VTSRPYGIVVNGQLELGYELDEEGNLRPHTGVPEPFVLSPAFINAHSHLEYRGLEAAIPSTDYWNWIRELTRLKSLERDENVESESLKAASENVQSGVACIGEHSDRPYAAAAIRKVGLRGVIFQELITFFEQLDPKAKLASVEQKAERQRDVFEGPVHVAPHATYTVDEQSLLLFRGNRCSIHVAETPDENKLFHSSTGVIADFFRSNSLPLPKQSRSALQYLDELGLVSNLTQLVHCCAIDEEDLATIAKRGASVAHCPRSNEALRCPVAPIRRLLSVGVPVGLGLDSPASSGPIDMFAEMRSAIGSSQALQEPLSAETIWSVATTQGLKSLTTTVWPEGRDFPLPWIKIHVPDARQTSDLVERGHPELVEWCP